MEIKDKDLEGVSGGIELEGLSKAPENDYDVVYKKEGSEPDRPTDVGTYSVDITL